MKITAIAFTKNGAVLLDTLKKPLGAESYAPEKYAFGDTKILGSLDALVRKKFKESDAIVFIGACGIAVRAVAPYVKDKLLDSAVVVMDEKGRYAIPLLSGHIGGANALAVKIAEITGAEPVITTATDINNKFAADVFAVKNNLRIGNAKLIKEISSRVLDGEKIGLVSDCPLKNTPDIFTSDADVGIYIGNADKRPFPATLTLMPKNIILGIGCRRGAKVGESIPAFLEQNGIDKNSVAGVATIDIKKDEKGITAFCAKHNIPLLTFTAEELSAVPGNFTSSDFVKNTVGTDNVCERAVCAAGAELTVKKSIVGACTLALGRKDIEIDFLKG